MVYTVWTQIVFYASSFILNTLYFFVPIYAVLTTEFPVRHVCSGRNGQGMYERVLGTNSVS